ncbi:MAG: GNAT family N-acetyltransferase [Methylocella sp.]
MTEAHSDQASAQDIDNVLRIATTDDYQEIFRICCVLHQENGQHEFSEEKAKNVIWRGVNRQNAIIGVIGPSNDIRAVIYLEICPVYYSDEMQLLELFNFVRPDYRKSDYAKRMIQFAKHAADQTGLDLLIGVISDTRLEAKKRLYERLLPVGGVFFNYRASKKDAA